MSYTKGKLTQGKSNTLLYINGVNFGDVLVGGLPHEECEANATELIHRWNSHDKLQKQSDLLTLGLLQEKQKTSALLSACERYVRMQEEINQEMGRKPTNTMYDIMKAAIAAGKE